VKSGTAVTARLIAALSKLSKAELEDKINWADRRFARNCEWVEKSCTERLLKAIDLDPELALRIPPEFTGGMVINEAMDGALCSREALINMWPAVRDRHKMKRAERSARITAARHRLSAIRAVIATPLFFSCGGPRELAEAHRELAEARQPAADGAAPLTEVAELFGRREDDSDPNRRRAPGWPRDRWERIEALANFLWVCEVIGIGRLPPIEEW
jgi:hypothetical protein